MGILKIENMLTGFNELKQKETTLTMANYFLWLGIVHSLPCEWRRMIKAGNISLFSQPTLPRNFHSDQIHVKPNENSVVEIQALTSKQIYKKLVTKRTLEPTSKAKFTAIFSENNLDWANIYKIPFNSTLDTRTRAFQLKILHRILFTNSALFKMKISATPLCTFCGLESETLEHLFVDCEYVKSFWEVFTAWVNSLGIVLNQPTDQEIMLGITGNRDDCKLVNHLLILRRQTIFYCRQQKLSPKFTLFQLRVQRIIEIEKIIATKRDKLSIHLSKWEKVVPFF